MRPRTGEYISLGSYGLWVGEELGSGGEGVVLALVDQHGQARMALKCYHRDEPWRRELLMNLTSRGAPNDRFLWPWQMIESATGSLGYVMPLRPDNYVPVSLLLKGKVERREAQVLTFALDLAQSFLALHLFGFCYRDVNYNNALFHVATGRALICDNDNVGIDGRSSSKVLGVPQFMAPEVILGSAMPSKVTDHHSLAVMLFYLLLIAHPLEGRATEAWQQFSDFDEARRHFFGRDPVFVFDPSDDRNRPDDAVQPHLTSFWAALPRVLQRLFTQAFTTGLRDPDARVQVSEWCDALLRARGRLWSCPDCGLVDYLDESTNRCRSCGRRAESLLRINGYRLVVSSQLEITRNHLSYGFDDPTVVAAVEAHPSAPGVLGLRNDSGLPWQAADGSGRTTVVEPGRRLRLSPGVRIVMAGSTATVESVAG